MGSPAQITSTRGPLSGRYWDELRPCGEESLTFRRVGLSEGLDSLPTKWGCSPKRVKGISTMDDVRQPSKPGDNSKRHAGEPCPECSGPGDYIQRFPYSVNT